MKPFKENQNQFIKARIQEIMYFDNVLLTLDKGLFSSYLDQGARKLIDPTGVTWNFFSYKLIFIYSIDFWIVNR